MFNAGRSISCRLAIGGHRGEVLGADVVDAVHGAGLQLDQALGGLGAPAEHQGLGDGRVAPVVVVAGQDQLVAAVPLLEHVGAGADRVADQRVAAAAGLLEVVRGVDREGGERHLRAEGHVRVAQLEADRQGIDGLDLAELTAVRAVGRRVGQSLEGDGRGRGAGGRGGGLHARGCRRCRRRGGFLLASSPQAATSRATTARSAMSLHLFMLLPSVSRCAETPRGVRDQPKPSRPGPV